jgi:uncharacterized protein (TIGR02597 family)
MNIPQKTLSLLAIATLTTFSSLTAVETDPVGYLTFTAADAADTKFGLPMEQAAVLSTSVDSVASGVVTVSVDASAASDSHYLQFSDGALVGQWFQVSTSSATSITVAEDLEALGAAAGDIVRVIPFWTLSTLFGTDFPVSTDPFTPVAQVLGNDVTGVGVNKAPSSNYAYHDGSSGFIAAGWFDTSNAFGGSVDDQKLAPDTFITIRNQSGSSYSLVLAGAVPTLPLSIGVVADASLRNDNLVYNPYPAAIQLSLSSLIDVVDVSTDPFTPLSEVVVYESFSGLNPAPSANYAYHDGSSGFVPAGWFNTSNAFGGSQDTVTIPQGGAFIIRKGAGTPSGYWTASLPYTL